MNMTRNILAIDLGATSGRGILAKFDGENFSMDEIYRFPNSNVEKDGKFYWDVWSLLDHCKAAVSEALKLGPVDSIGIDTWGVDFGCIGADGKLTGLPRAYRDPYTVGAPDKVFAIIPREEVYSLTGIQVMDFNTLFQLKALKDEGSEALANAAHILFMPDLLAYLLTGNMVCEYTDASTGQIINPRTREVEKSLLERIGVSSDLVLPIIFPGTEIGRYQGIPVVAVAGHDTASAIAAVPASDSKFAYLSSGTWSLMGIEAQEPIINDESCSLNFTNEGGIEGSVCFLKNICGMWLLEQSRKVWKAQGREYTYAQIEQMARSAEDFKGVFDPDDPRLAAPADMPKAICEVLAENGMPLPSTDAEFISCIYHSLACKYKVVIDMLQKFAPFPIEALHVIGGGSANAYMNQLTANAIGKKVVAGPTEATAIGNIMIQARTLGLVSDVWDMRRVIAKTFRVRTFLPE